MESENLGYVWEQLYGAVSSLATGNLSAKDRLKNAVVSRVHRVFPSTSTEDKLPSDISERLSQLEEKVTKNGSFEETIEQMDDQEVDTIIEEIFSLFNKVARAYPDTE